MLNNKVHGVRTEEKQKKKKKEKKEDKKPKPKLSMIRRTHTQMCSTKFHLQQATETRTAFFLSFFFFSLPFSPLQ
jgi:hypothetical protein